jgi:transcription initiation factor TFIIIB Brf1 subunit/transcription initiation factor TFIIB
MFDEGDGACVECGSRDFVVDRTTCDEICRGCGVVRQTVSFDFDAGFSYEGRFQNDDEAMISAVTGQPYFSNSTIFEKAKGVSSRVAAESRNPDAGSRNSEALLSVFLSEVRSRCHARTGILARVHATALEIFSAFLKLASTKCPKAKPNARNAKVYAAVCVQMATKLERCERSDVEIQNLFEVPKKKYSAAFSRVVEALAGHPLHARIAAISRPISLTPRILDALGDAVDDGARKTVRRIASGAAYEAAERAMIGEGASGNVIAAALIHLASDKTIRVDDLAEVVGYTPNALDKAVSKIELLLRANE